MAKAKGSEKKKKPERVGKALLKASLEAEAVAPEHSSLVSQTILTTLAEKWIDDPKVGIEQVKKVYEEVFTVNVRDEAVNPQLLKLKLDLASKTFDVFEQYLATRIREKRLSFAMKERTETAEAVVVASQIKSPESDLVRELKAEEE